MTVVTCCKIQCNTCHQMASLAFRLHKIQFRPGLRTGPRWGSSRRSPRLPSRLGRGIPPPHSSPPRRLWRLAVDAFGIDIDTPTFETLSRPWERAPQLFQTTLSTDATYVWSPHRVGQVKRVESVQRKFTKRLPGHYSLDCKSRLMRLHADSLELRRLRYDLIYTYKVVFGLVND